MTIYGAEVVLDCCGYGRWCRRFDYINKCGIRGSEMSLRLQIFGELKILYARGKDCDKRQP